MTTLGKRRDDRNQQPHKEIQRANSCRPHLLQSKGRRNLWLTWPQRSRQNHHNKDARHVNPAYGGHGHNRRLRHCKRRQQSEGTHRPSLREDNHVRPTNSQREPVVLRKTLQHPKSSHQRKNRRASRTRSIEQVEEHPSRYLLIRHETEDERDQSTT